VTRCDNHHGPKNAYGGAANSRLRLDKSFLTVPARLAAGNPNPWNGGIHGLVGSAVLRDRRANVEGALVNREGII
jgi:hypothetical protein